MSIQLIDIQGYVQALSVSSNSIGTGTKVFNVVTDEPFELGMEVTVEYDATHSLEGTVTKYEYPQLTVSVSAVTGSGTYAAWVIGGIRNVRLATHGYTSQSDDTPPDVYYLGCLYDPGNFAQYLFSTGHTYGKSEVSKGDIIANNHDGELDFMKKLGFAKGGLTLRRVEKLSEKLDDAEIIFNGFISTVEFSDEQIRISIRDRLAELDVPAQLSVFDGSNAGSSGIEGSTNGIKGNTKPFVYGKVEEIRLKLLNDSTQIYGCNFDSDGDTKAVTSFDAVYDSGLLKTKDTAVGTGGNVANLAALQAAVITNGKYITCLSEGLIRLEGLPAGDVTADVTEANRAAGAIVELILTERGGYVSSDYNSGSISALDVDKPAIQGIYIDDSTTLLDCITQILQGVHGYIIANTSNEFEIGYLAPPEDATPVVVFDNSNTEGLQYLASQDEGNGVPAKQSVVYFRKNYLPRGAGQLENSVSNDRRNFLENEYRKVVSDPLSYIQAKHPNSPTLEFLSLFTDESDASDENDLRVALYSVERDFIQFTNTEGTVVELGEVITMIHDRYGFEDGKDMRVLGRILNFENNTLDYIAWG